MLVFLSWSGERSKSIARELETWLQQVIQAIEPWISVDIEKGVRWGTEISEKLERSRVGIICLTAENLDSRWILFEAGALSKVRDAHACTLLLDVSPSNVEQPLAQFQHTTTTRDDVFRLVQTLNAAVERAGERALGEAVLVNVFNTFWPSLEKTFARIAACRSPTPIRKRDNTAILEEILTLVRNLERRDLLEEPLAERLRQLEAIQGFLLPKLTSASRAQLLEYLQVLPNWRNLRSLADLYALRMEEAAVPEPDSPSPKESSNESEGSAS